MSGREGERYCQAMLLLRHVAGRPDLNAEIAEMRQLLHSQLDANRAQMLSAIDLNWAAMSVDQRCLVLGQVEDAGTWPALRASMRQLPEHQRGQIEDSMLPELMSAADLDPAIWRSQRSRVVGNRGLPPRELTEMMLDESETGDLAAHQTYLTKHKKRFKGLGMIDLMYKQGDGGLACGGLAALDLAVRERMGRTAELDEQDFQYIKSLEPQCAESLSIPLWKALFGSTLSAEELAAIVPVDLLTALNTLRAHALLTIATLFVKCLNTQAVGCAAEATCGYCGVHSSSLSTCARCQLTLYCSRDCQKADWKKHKKQCGKP